MREIGVFSAEIGPRPIFGEREEDLLAFKSHAVSPIDLIPESLNLMDCWAFTNH